MREVKLTDGRVVPTQDDTPWTWQIGEVIIVMYAPYGAKDLWSDQPKWKPAH